VLALGTIQLAYIYHHQLKDILIKYEYHIMVYTEYNYFPRTAQKPLQAYPKADHLKVEFSTKRSAGDKKDFFNFKWIYEKVTFYRESDRKSHQRT
jgi:hypothetical protein